MRLVVRQIALIGTARTVAACVTQRVARGLLRNNGAITRL